MPAMRNPLHLHIETHQSEKQLDSHSIAEAFARDLQTDSVTQWADTVNTVIAAAKRTTLEKQQPVQDDLIAKQRASIQAQIAELQKQMQRLEVS